MNFKCLISIGSLFIPVLNYKVILLVTVGDKAFPRIGWSTITLQTCYVIMTPFSTCCMTNVGYDMWFVIKM